MKNKLLWILAILFIPFFLNAQPLVKMGTPYPVVDAGNKFYFHIDKDILTVKIKGDEVYISILNPQTLEQANSFINNTLPKSFSFNNVIQLENKFYFFYTIWDKANETEHLLSQKINVNTCKLDGEVNQILTMKGRGNIFNYYYSYDKSKVLIMYRLKPEIKRDALNYAIIGLNIFDDNLNKISLQEIKMSHTEKQMDNIDYAVDSDGNAYVLSLVKNDTPEKENGKNSHFVEILKIKPNSPIVTTIPVVLQGKYITKLWLYESSKNKMVCAGYYSKQEDSYNANGLMMFNINNDNKIVGMIHHDIPIEVLNQFVSEKAQLNNEEKEKRDKAEFENLQLRNFIVQSDGSILLIGEQYFSSNTVSNFQGRQHPITHVIHSDILACKLNADGSLAWMRKLPKRQVAILQGVLSYYPFYYKGTMSYQYMNGGEDHYFLFLDNKKNMELSLNKYPKIQMDGPGFLTAYKVNDSSGLVNKISILDTRGVEGIPLHQFSVDRILPISAKEFVFEAYKKGKEDVMLKVTFP